MIGVMKHIRLLVMIGLCLNPVTMMASEWTNIPVPSLNPETQPTGNKVLERIMASALGHIENDPKLVLLQIAAGCLVLMICYMHKTGSLGRTVNQARDAVKKEIKAWFDRLPMPVKAAMMPLKVV
ncbi:MAG TPA: hypothetical protein VJJ26_01875, partial [Candidatus Babeliales bacterium]|nr:hypothetical protein [Candidatus Babeliales bacterium]